MATVLVGREEELRALTSASGVPPAVVFLAGEAGVGKTRLITELDAAVRSRSRWVAVGRCQPMRFPFGAVFDGLRTLGAQVRLGPVTGVLRPYLPELAERLPPELEPLADSSADRHRLFRAVRELLCALGPGMLIIEDLQWADEGSRQLLRFLVAEPPDGLTVVLTYRDEELSGSGPLGGTGRPGPGVGTLRMRLEPLDVTGVRRLAAGILDVEQVTQGFASALHEHTAGIPFVVEEVLRTLDLGAEAAQASAAWTARRLEGMDPPAVLREAMIERLGGLSEDARLVSEVAAVLGEPSAGRLLGEVARTGQDRTRAALIEALGGNVLVEVDSGRYGFRHAAGMRALYRTLPGPHRQELHTRAMRALGKLQPAPLLQLAEHSRKAGRVAEWLSYGEAAADNAAASGDPACAISLLQRLIAEPSLRSSDMDRLATKFGWIASHGLEQVGVTAALERLVTDRRTSDEIRGELRLGLGLLLHRQLDGLEASRVELELAAAELRPRPALAARAMAVLAEPYVGTTPLSETSRWMRRVVDSIELFDKRWRTTLLATVLASRLHVGDHSVWQDIPQLPVHVDSVEEQRQLARAHCNLADACSWIGHYDKARMFLSTGLRLANDCGAAYIASTGLSTQAHLDFLTGNWAGLADRASTLLESYRDLLPVSTELSLVLGSLAVAQGEWEQAERHLAATGLSTPDNAITPVIMSAHGMTITLHLSTDNPEAAGSAADQAAELLRRKGVWAWAGEIAPAVVAAYCRIGRLEAAAALITEMKGAVRAIDAPMARAAVHICEAELAHVRGDTSAAAAGFEQALVRLEQLPRPYLAAQLAERATCNRLELGDLDAAGRLTDLADRFDRLGATRDAARCRHVARQNGATQRSRRGRRGYGDDLSPREHDVARLLAGGRTNREIAEVLFLSRRTVEQHVANVLHKLGAASRRDLLDADLK